MQKTSEVVRIEDLIPYENNPRKNDKAVEAVKESIKQCGYISPIIIDESNVILAGHTRLKAFYELGTEEIECMRVSGLTEEQKKKFRLLDNKVGEIAEWDFDQLAEELEGMDFRGFEFDWGINPDEEIEIEEIDVPEIPEETTTKLGDIWQLGEHRLICGDATSIEDIRKLMGEKKADLLIVDPPYNIDYEGKTAEKMKIKNDKWESGEFVEFLKRAFIAAKENLKSGGGVLHMACRYGKLEFPKSPPRIRNGAKRNLNMEEKHFHTWKTRLSMDSRTLLIWME